MTDQIQELQGRIDRLRAAYLEVEPQLVHMETTEYVINHPKEQYAEVAENLTNAYRVDLMPGDLRDGDA